jgi:ketosteroid isomerase-like protein
MTTTVGSTDTVHRALCHSLFDAIEQEDSDRMRACFAPGMTLWFNVTGEESTVEEIVAAQAEGRRLHRRRTYDDRIISTFADGFVVQYSLGIVLHDGSRRSLSACAVAEVHDGQIVKLSEYVDSSRFGGGR